MDFDLRLGSYGCDVAWIDSHRQTFRDYKIFPSSRLQQDNKTDLGLKIWTINCSKTLVNNYQTALCNVPYERISDDENLIWQLVIFGISWQYLDSVKCASEVSQFPEINLRWRSSEKTLDFIIGWQANLSGNQEIFCFAIFFALFRISKMSGCALLHWWFVCLKKY